MSKPTSHSAGAAGSKLIDRRPILKAMLNPKVIALVGATEAPDSVGRALMGNLASFGGVVYPINPKRRSVLGVEALPNIEAVPNQVDLAIIATPAVTVPFVVKECADAAVKGAVIISAGFKECGPEGKKAGKSDPLFPRKDAFNRTELSWGDDSRARFKRHFFEKNGAPRQCCVPQPKRCAVHIGP
jgi:predicted CoA-binding protein